MENEKQLIDAKDLYRKLVELADLYDVDYLFFDVITDEIDNAPIVDALEVVRCKDCQKWIADITCHTYINGEMHPMGCCQHTRRFTADCDFCSHGEKR